MEHVQFVDLVEGQQLPTLQKPPIEKVQLVKYAGASGDFNMIHTDDETAKKVGLGGVIAHGMLSMGFLGEYAGAIVGTEGFVKDIEVRFSGMVRPGDSLVCTGTVTSKDEEHRLARVSVAAQKEDGKPVTSGTVTLQYR